MAPSLGLHRDTTKQYVNSLLGQLASHNIQPLALPTRGLAPADTDPNSPHVFISYPTSSSATTIQPSVEQADEDDPNGKQDRLQKRYDEVARELQAMNGKLLFYFGKYEEYKTLKVEHATAERLLHVFLDQQCADDTDMGDVGDIMEDRIKELDRHVTALKEYIFGMKTKLDGAVSDKAALETLVNRLLGGRVVQLALRDKPTPSEATVRNNDTDSNAAIEAGLT
jgi:hypothetical protein